MKNSFLSGKTFRLSEFKETQLPTFAYAVDTKDVIVEKQLIGKDGTFNFYSKDDGLRLLIAPEPQGSPEPRNVKDLEERNPYQPVLRFNPRTEFQEVANIPEILVTQWFFCFCRVRVKLQKQFCFSFPTFPPFGSGRKFCLTFPVCHARVHVCRVKPRIFQTLPAIEILRIRDRLIELPKRWPVPPIPDPGPLRGNFATKAATTFAVQNTSILDATLVAQLQTNSVDLLRSTLAQNLVTIRPWLPYLDICSWLYTCEEIFVAEVDCEGRLDQGFWHNCSRDENLYFWVEYLFDGKWVTVYRPRLCSGTHWDFECGDEITITLDDARVGVCQPTKSRFMYVSKIGTQGYLPLINQSTGFISGLGFSGDSDDSTTSQPSSAHLRPFGGNLSLWCDFGSELPEAATATHYQVSYKAIGASDWEILKDDVLRSYREEVEGPDGIVRSEQRSFNLRDTVHSGFYVIPENEASNQTGIDDPVGYVPNSREWYFNTEFVIANWDTRAIPEGDYQLRIQLCKMVGGSPQPVALRREIFQTPKIFEEMLDSDIAPVEHLYGYNSGTGEASGIIIRLHIDNRKCTSKVENAIVNGRAADPNCGLLSTALSGVISAQLEFKAEHPDNQGTFAFSMIRGNNQPVGSGVSSPNALGKIGEPLVNGYTYNAVNDHYVRVFSDAGYWLTEGACANGAAFAQTLHVRALATDGTNRLWNYDAPSITAAFAIIKDCDCD